MGTKEMTFEEWCKTKGLTPSKCDETNLWIREAFEGGKASVKQQEVK
jgi:hypothetical protein